MARTKEQILESLSLLGKELDPISFIDKLSFKDIDVKGHAFDRSGWFVTYDLLDIQPIVNKNKTELTRTLTAAMNHLIYNPNPEHAFACCNQTCSICGKEVPIYFDGDKIFIKDECEEKFGEYSFDIAVPSGLICFENDLREYFPSTDYYVNHFYGVKNTTRDYAKYGMFHPFVGNNSPIVVKRRNGTIEIGRFAGKNYISTDLWWVSACDAQILQKRVEMKGQTWTDAKDFCSFTVKVKPGVYRCTTRPLTRDVQDPYCKMELISEEIPEDMVFWGNLNNVDNKNESFDSYKDYLNSAHFDLFQTFKDYISFYNISESDRGDNSQAWFQYDFDEQKFENEILSKYPNIDEMNFSEIENIPVFSSPCGIYTKKLDKDKNPYDEFSLSTSTVMRFRRYAQHFTVYAYILVYAWSILKNNEVQEKDVNQIKRIVALCLINLKERGLLNKALSWLENIREEIEKEPKHPQIAKRFEQKIEQFRPLFSSAFPEINFDKFKSDFIKNNKREDLGEELKSLGQKALD